MMAHASSWVLITANAELLSERPFAGAEIEAAAAPPEFQGWTDQYSSIWSVLKIRRSERTTVASAE